MSQDRSPLRRHRGDAGFTIIEVMVALVVFALLATAAAASLNGAMSLTSESRQRTSAANLAERQKESSIGLGYDALAPGSYPTQTVTIGQDAYNIDQSVTLLPATGTRSSCDAPTGSRLAYKRVSVVITWPGMGDVAPVRNETMLAVPVARLNSELGAVSVPVLDRDSGPQQGITVALNPGGRTAVSDEDGCAVFTDLAPDTYTATVNQSGYVGLAGTAEFITQPVGVISGTITKTETILYDLGATLQYAYQPPGGFPQPLPETGVALDASPIITERAVPGCVGGATAGCLPASNQLANTFPVSGGGYRTWAGTCAGGAAGAQQSATTPGEMTPPIALPTGGVDIVVSRSADDDNDESKRYTLTLEHSADSLCSTGVRLDAGIVELLRGETATLRVSVPYGTWIVKVTDEVRGSTEAGSFTTGPSDRTAAMSVTL